MILSIVGPPHTGMSTLGRARAAEHDLAMVDFATIQGVISRGVTEAAQQARALVESGRLVPDDLFVALIHQCVNRDAVVVGYPRTEGQLRSMVAARGAANLVVMFLDGTRDLVDARRAAMGLPPVHPGGFKCLSEALAPVVAWAAAAQCLLRLDPARSLDHLLSVAGTFLAGRKR